MTAAPNFPSSNPQPPNLRRQVSASIRSESFEGPIPPPAVLEAYESLVPGAAERILSMAERQAGHRQEIEKIVIKAGARDQLLGVMVSAIVALGALWWAKEALAAGQSVEGVITILGAIGAFAGAYMYGKSSTKKEREARGKQNKPAE